MLTVREINDPAELNDYRLAWRRLLGETRGGTFFQSLDWLAVYWRHFGADQKLRVLLVFADRELAGILPLAECWERTRAGVVRVLTYPLHGWGSFYGPIGPNPTLTLQVGLAHVAASEREWDLLDLRWIDWEHSDRGRTAGALRAAGLSARRQVWGETAWVDLSGGWESYWCSRGARWRAELRRCERRLTDLGGVRYVHHRPAGTCGGDAGVRWDLFDDCAAIAGESWQGRSTTGTTLTHEPVREFFRAAHEAATHAGGADLHLLYVGDRSAAFAYNIHWGGRVYGLRTGFDPEVALPGAGKVLLAKMLRQCAELGDTLVDLGPGSIDVKRHWLTSVERSYRCTCYGASWRAQALRIKHWWTARRAA